MQQRYFQYQIIINLFYGNQCFSLHHCNRNNLLRSCLKLRPVLFYPPSFLHKYSIFYNILQRLRRIFVVRTPFLSNTLSELLFGHRRLTYQPLLVLINPLYQLFSHLVRTSGVSMGHTRFQELMVMLQMHWVDQGAKLVSFNQKNMVLGYFLLQVLEVNLQLHLKKKLIMSFLLI